MLDIQEEKLQQIEYSNPLSCYDHKILEDMAEILAPYEEAAHFLQGQNCVTISYVILCMRGLEAHLVDMVPIQLQTSVFPETFTRKEDEKV